MNLKNTPDSEIPAWVWESYAKRPECYAEAYPAEWYARLVAWYQVNPGRVHPTLVRSEAELERVGVDSRDFNPDLVDLEEG